jgi:hypothetical protein
MMLYVAALSKFDLHTTLKSLICQLTVKNVTSEQEVVNNVLLYMLVTIN